MIEAVDENGSKDTILIKLTKIFQSVFKNPGLIINDQMTAVDVKGWDSLSHMVLIAEIEERFEIKIKLKDLNNMKNVGDMIEIIKNKL